MTTRFTRSGQAGRSGGRGRGGGARVTPRTGLNRVTERNKVELTVLTNERKTGVTPKIEESEERAIEESKNVNITNEINKTETEKEKEINFDLINAISEDYIKDNETWNDPLKVQQKIIDLECEITNIVDKETKKSVQKVLDAYQHRLKVLNLKEGPYNEAAREKSDSESGKTKSTPPKQGKTYEVDNNGTIEILDTPSPTSKTRDLQSKNQKNKLEGKEKTESVASSTGGEIETSKTEIETTANFITPQKKTKENETSRQDDEANTNQETIKRKLSSSGDKKEENKTQKSTWSQRNGSDSTVTKLFRPSENESMSNLQAKAGQNNEVKNEKQIRLRIQFKAKTRKNNSAMKHEEIISTLLYSFMQSAQQIDPKVALMPWANTSTHDNLNGNELRLHTGEKVNDYIDIPDLKENLIEGKTYYQNGIRLKTEMSVYEFTERWSKMRYEKAETRENNEWTPIKPAEMQKADKAYPIGYFTGTTERGDYRTINECISEITKTETEVSFQFVNQNGVTSKIWQFARQQAERANENPNSKIHKRTKFKYAPSALTVYISDKTAIKETRRTLIEKYGKLDNGSWPVMPDGSRMRFVPIIFGIVNENSINKKKQQVFNYLYDQLALQASAKAGEVLLDLEMWDLFTRHKYMNNSTLEEVLHGLTSTTKPGIPIFKHITRKWSRTPSDENYEVAVAPSMLKEAQETLRTIRPALKRKFGLCMNNHFNPPRGRRNNYQVNRRDEYDPELEDFLVSATMNDQYSRVLIEGMDCFLDSGRNKNEVGNNGKQNAMLINEGHQDEKKKSKPNNLLLLDTNQSLEVMEVNSKVKSKQNEEEKGDIMSVFSNLTKNSKAGTKAGWDQVTIADAYEDCVPASEDQIKKIEERISTYNITLEEIEKWKTENCEEFEKMTSGDGANEYKTLMRVIKGVIETRKEQQEINKEVERIANILDEEKEKEKALGVVAQGRISSLNQQAYHLHYNTSSTTSKGENVDTGTVDGRRG